MAKVPPRRRDDDDDEDERVTPRRPAPRQPARPERARRDEDDEPARPARARRRDEDDEDYEDENERPRRRKKPAANPVLNLALVGVAVACVGALIAVPFLSWISISKDIYEGEGRSNKVLSWVVKVTGRGEANVKFEAKRGDSTKKEEETSKVGDDGKPDGLAILIVACFLAAVALAGLGLLLPADPSPGVRQGRDLVLLSLLAGLSLVILWLLAWVIKVVMLSRKINEKLSGETPGFKAGNIVTTTMPGLGLFIGLGAAIAAAICVNIVASSLTKRHWVYVAQGVGLLLAVAIVLPLTQPWTAEKLFDALGKII
jgi:hypothetical protein